MSGGHSLVLESQRHLKWRRLDALEQGLMILCGVALAGFTTTVFFDVVTRILGHPWLWLQEVTTTFFVYGVFIGTAVAAPRPAPLLLSARTAAIGGRPPPLFETLHPPLTPPRARCLVGVGFLHFRP